MPVDNATYSGNLWNLFEVSYIADGKENTFSYDARGNRLTEIETYTGSNGRVTDYEYYENSDLIKKAGKWYFNYDKNGNLLSRGTSTTASNGSDFNAWTFKENDGELWTYEYDLQNRMTKACYSGKGSANLKERGSYIYDYRGLLIKKTYQNYTPSDLVEVANEETSKPVTEFYEYTADGRVIYNERSEESDTTKTTYIWANTTLWCEINNGVVYYHHTDHLGTTEVITNENGTMVWEAGYEAFGSVLNERGESKFTPSYTGKFFDKASGLYYFNARWYDSELGKFTSEDPARDGSNWYGYAGQNPTNFVDSNGLFVVTAVLAKAAIGATTGALIGFSTNIIVQVGSNIIKQATSGNDINLKSAITNVDFKSAGAAALSGAISGAITGGAGAVKSIATAVQTSKRASAALNATANIVGTTVGTVVDNGSHDKNLTDGLALNLAISATSGIISGATSKTGTNVIDRTNGSETIMYTETIDSAEVITIITTVSPNEIDKDIGVSIGQEISGAISNSIEGN